MGLRGGMWYKDYASKTYNDGKAVYISEAGCFRRVGRKVSVLE